MHLRRDLVGRVLLEHAGLCLHDLPERPQGDAVAVCEAAALAPGDELGIGVDDALELVHEPALADAGDADEREELRRALVTGALERVADDPELALAADELGARLVRHVDAEARVRGDGRPDGNRLRLPLRFDGLGRFVVDSGPGGAVRRLVDDDPVDRCRALQACRGVDDVARGHALAGVGLGVEPDERLAGGDADSQLEPFLERELTDCERRADGPFGIVLVRGRGAEQRHDRVPDELLDGAAVPLELPADALVVRREEGLDVLGIHRLGTSREPDEVAEDDRDDLALAP